MGFRARMRESGRIGVISAGLDRIGLADLFMVVHNGNNWRREQQALIWTPEHDFYLGDEAPPVQLYWSGDADLAIGRLMHLPDGAGWEAFFDSFPLREWQTRRPPEAWF